MDSTDGNFIVTFSDRFAFLDLCNTLVTFGLTYLEYKRSYSFSLEQTMTPQEPLQVRTRKKRRFFTDDSEDSPCAASKADFGYRQCYLNCGLTMRACKRRMPLLRAGNLSLSSVTIMMSFS